VDQQRAPADAAALAGDTLISRFHAGEKKPASQRANCLKSRRLPILERGQANIRVAPAHYHERKATQKPATVQKAHLLIVVTR
jgi:hypothetical protein